LIKPDPNYRANPKRAVFVSGRIDESLLARVVPQIVALQGESREPITVYIDSPGGSLRHQESLCRVLNACDQNHTNSCTLITVVTSTAASAAADLLCSGAYAIAYAGSTIFFHGVRSNTDDPITVARASALMESMRLTNDQYAMSLADKSISRIGFRYFMMRHKFEEYKKQNSKKDDVECFVGLTAERLSPSALRVVSRARKRYLRYDTLVNEVARKVLKRKQFTAAKRTAESEASIIKAIVEFELSQNRSESWTFADRGFSQINDDFLLVKEYANIYDSAHLKKLCDRFSEYFLSPEDQEEIKKISDETSRATVKHEKLKTILRPLWLFFVALCYALQEEENELSATDAFWLGLIDEVVGRPGELMDLVPIRWMYEYEDDPPALETVG
jgi:ATP-dependent protease ClpP protease subunit